MVNVISPISVLDYIGNSFQCNRYKRIVSLVPSITETLFSLGLEKNIVGVTKFCSVPTKARESPRVVVGGTKNPDIDLIKKLNPDLVIINKEENRLRHFTLLQNTDIPIFVTFPKNIDQAVSMINNFINLFQITSSKVISNFKEIKKVCEEIKRKVELIPTHERRKVFCPIWKNPWMSFNQDTFGSAVIEFCGGENVFSNSSERYPKLSIEDIVNSDPDIILLPDEPYDFGEKDKSDLLLIPELKKKEIIFIDGSFHWYSFRIKDTIISIYNLLYKI